ncbi:hypothetical protein HX793_22270 [Pseudomonas reactans]|uniref:hypothetical protein n=1 Tax=Pseudomonas reactans TaxID=117680 RepID=UPI0015BEEFDF|nr:hypothetical protein [Pseudomonas reactans]NWA44706.1 hypothetical protein [Pseudomonas reactans]NWD32512.1 hypothetical protein [Pseudomonas reactans]
MKDMNEDFVNSEYHYSVGEGDLMVAEVEIPKEVQFDPVYLMDMVVKQITDDLKQQGKIVKRADQPFVDVKNSSVLDIFVTGPFDPFTLKACDAADLISPLKDS